MTTPTIHTVGRAMILAAADTLDDRWIEALEKLHEARKREKKKPMYAFVLYGDTARMASRASANRTMLPASVACACDAVKAYTKDRRDRLAEMMTREPAAEPETAEATK